MIDNVVFGLEVRGVAAGPARATGTPLDIAVKQLSEAGREAALVVDDQNRPVGTISLKTIMARL